MGTRVSKINPMVSGHPLSPNRDTSTGGANAAACLTHQCIHFVGAWEGRTQGPKDPSLMPAANRSLSRTVRFMVLSQNACDGKEKHDTESWNDRASLAFPNGDCQI